jgi:lipopolysaccharide export system protein LptC
MIPSTVLVPSRTAGLDGSIGVDRLTTVSPIDGSGSRGFTLKRRGDGARVFRSAMRHSRRVRFLRLAIPAGLLVTVALVLLAARLDPLRMLAKLPVDFGSLVVSGTKITMQQPRLAGFTRDSRPYELTADAAAQDITKPDTIELQGIHGTGKMQDESTLELTARGGVYDTKTEMLSLRQDVVLKSSTGLQAFLSEALVDVHAGNVVSDKPVEVRMPQGIINANRLDVSDSGAVITFQSGVTMVLTPSHSPAQGNAKPGAP